MSMNDIEGYKLVDCCGICSHSLLGGYDPRGWAKCMEEDEDVSVLGWCPKFELDVETEEEREEREAEEDEEYEFG